ncbi:hypothetical protein ANO11243_057660 [Dothideomycetidae sp. 11243]|nr:hypothetical protein ANO11243_057660 [fungal sp. No.11243]
MVSTSAIFAAASAAALVSAASTDAPVITNNPVGAQYLATFTATAQNTVNGNVQISTYPNGQGVTIQMSMSGFPGENQVSDYLYHIHTDPVPADGNCTATLGHLDPYGRGETPACDPTQPWSCQVGDLSGKHGTIPGGSTGFSALYQDLFVSTDPTSNASVFGRSIVFHFPNKTRIACANIQQISLGAYTNSSSSATGTATASSSATCSAPPTGTTATMTSTTETSSATPVAPGSGSYGNATMTTATPTGPKSTSTVTPFAGAATTTKVQSALLALGMGLVAALTLL